MYMKFLLIKPKVLYALFIFSWMWSRKDSLESKITPESFLFVSYSISWAVQPSFIKYSVSVTFFMQYDTILHLLILSFSNHSLILFVTRWRHNWSSLDVIVL